jgi:hypothetical protein
LRRSICRGRLEASTVFEPVLESSRLPLTVLGPSTVVRGTVPESVLGVVA